MLYLRSPVEQVVGILPSIARAKVAFLRISDLSSELQNSEPDLHLARPSSRVFLNNEIELKGVQYSFRSSSESVGFMIGPVDLRLRKGEMVFIVGDNGSGKTTLIKLLLGIYPPEKGEVLLDGLCITEENRDDYRQLFTTIFSDFYLFEELVVDFDNSRLSETAAEYLRRLEIADLVQIKNGLFSTLAVSTGQRKRLALVHAYLEQRPVIVFDEWAADQDPSFRHLFYTQLLPELRDRGHLVIAITHDDRYFYVADRVVQILAGKIVEDRRTQRASYVAETAV
jgi:putative ATP-binding cassette transporter